MICTHKKHTISDALCSVNHIAMPLATSSHRTSIAAPDIARCVYRSCSQSEPSLCTARSLPVHMLLGRAGAMVCRDSGATVATEMSDVLERVDAERNAAQAKADAEAQRPRTMSCISTCFLFLSYQTNSLYGIAVLKLHARHLPISARRAINRCRARP